MRIRWLGNSCVEIFGEKHLLIDPNYLVPPTEKIDLVLITHEHSDHIDVEKLSDLKYNKLIAPEFTLRHYTLDGIPAKVGDVIDGVEILESWCWKSEESVSYCYEGVLHNGDSAKFPDVEAKLVFTACFPDFYGEYVSEMKRLKPEIVIPIHYSYDKKENADKLKEKMNKAKIKCILLEIGEEIEI